MEIGDVVRLKSGGPKMTIRKMAVYPSYGEKDQAKCAWFDGSNPKEGVFDPEMLDLDDAT